jgi:hypothetical protein
MKKSKFTNEQIAFAIKQAETGTPIEEGVPEDRRKPADVLLVEEKVRWTEHRRAPSLEVFGRRTQAFEIVGRRSKFGQTDFSGGLVKNTVRPACLRECVEGAK